MINEISPSDQSEADFLDAVVVGLDLLHACSEGKKFARQRVFLFSAFLSNFDDEASGIEDIKKTLASVNAELSVIGLDDMGQIDAERENGRNDQLVRNPLRRKNISCFIMCVHFLLYKSYISVLPPAGLGGTPPLKSSTPCRPKESLFVLF